MKKYIISIILGMSVSAYAQTDSAIDSISSDSGEMPQGMFVTEDELMNDYNNRTNLSPGTTKARTLSYDDSVLVSRLSRIPTTIDLPLNNITKKYIDTYSNRLKGSVSVMLGAANFYNPIFEEALERYGLPLELKYLPVIESALRPAATSRVGAAGLWQFMIATGKRYGLEINTLVDERRDPIKSSDAAARYLRDLYGMFGDWGLAIAAYNCGEGNIQKAILRSGSTVGKATFWTVYDKLPRETRGYLPAFIGATYIMNFYCEHGIVPREATLPLESDTIVVAHDTRIERLASICNVNADEVRALNPQYRRDIVPANCALRLPAAAIEPFITREDSIYGVVNSAEELANQQIMEADEQPEQVSSRSGKRGRNQRNAQGGGKSVTVRSGDSLYRIAQRNGTTVAKLRQLNGARSNRLQPGQKIRVK